MKLKRQNSDWRFAFVFLPAVIMATLPMFSGSGAGASDIPDRTFFTNIKIIVDPANDIFGTPFTVTITGLKPGEQATITARSVDVSNVTWKSSATFRADDGGFINTSRQAPVSGDYTVANSLGLLWSMKPVDSQSKRIKPYAHDEVNGLTVHFTVLDSAGKEATARLRRYYQMPGKKLTRIPLEQDGLYGFLYSPDSEGPHPGVIILGGSNGGLYEWLAQAFASNGFAALTLAYFGYRDLPRELVEIPLEYVHQAAVWMKNQKMVKKNALGVVGGSKGGEMALLLGTVYDDFKAIVAWVPSGYVWQGISHDIMNIRSSWTLGGKAVPFIAGEFTMEDLARYKKGEYDSMLDYHFRAMKKADESVLEKATIPVEKIKAPILLVSGTDDQTWPSSLFSDSIIQRLEKNRHPYEFKHIRYEGAGHMIFLPYFITGQNRYMNGGNPKDDALGSVVSWEETIAFLHRHLDQ